MQGIVYETLKHTKWECEYHVVFIPKYRKQRLYHELRQHLGAVFRDLVQQKECQVEEGHLMPDHVHRLLAIPPKYAVAHVMGFVKGKSAIDIAQVWGGRKHQYVGQHFWARGYWVSAVGRDEAAVRVYIAEQEKEDQRLDQLEMFEGARRFERFIISSLRLCRRSLTPLRTTRGFYLIGIVRELNLEIRLSFRY